MSYLLIPASSVPALVTELAMRPPARYGSYWVYTYTPNLAAVPVDWQMPVPSAGEDPMTDDQMVMAVGHVMATGGIAWLQCNECHRLLKTPAWLICVRAYETIPELRAGTRLALGIELSSSTDLDTLQSEAYAALITALS